MFRSLMLGMFVASIASGLQAEEKIPIDTSWLSTTPEVQTYDMSGKFGEGMVQVSSLRSATGIEVQISTISPGFAKTVFGEMDVNLTPSKSKTRMFIDGQISMATDCDYSADGVRVSTSMLPYNQKLGRTLKSNERFVDFSQTLLLIRSLRLKPDAEFRFTSVNPKNNTLIPTKIRVVSEETIDKMACYKVQLDDFDGRSSIWVEKGGAHRIFKTETADGTITELIPFVMPFPQP